MSAEESSEADGRVEPEHTVKVPFVLAGAAAWSWRLLVITAAVALLAYLFIQLYVVVVPVVLALFLAAVLEPLVARLRARRWPPALAATAVFLGALGLLVLLLVWIGANVAGQFDDVGDRLDEAIVDAKEWLQKEPFELTPERVDELERDVRDAVRSAGGGVARQAADRAETAGEVLGGIVLLLFTLFFVMKDGFRMSDWMRERIPAVYREETVAIATRTRNIMRQYLVATALTGLIDGVLIGIALAVLGVPLVVPLAVLTFLGGFIPLVGATVAGIVAALVALVTEGVAVALLVVGATILVQQIEGNLLQPLILERAVRLHPLVTVWAVGAGLVVGGLLGAFLAVPMTAIGVGVTSYYYGRANPAAADPAADPEAPEPEAPGPEAPGAEAAAPAADEG
ncbi:MAG TPA: AI-2E family transporter [Acidimicrobiales bacterium]|nr:AI-2E family transporter [Acidimicrobiales bacterium]